MAKKNLKQISKDLDKILMVGEVKINDNGIPYIEICHKFKHKSAYQILILYGKKEVRDTLVPLDIITGFHPYSNQITFKQDETFEELVVRMRYLFQGLYERIVEKCQ